MRLVEYFHQPKEKEGYIGRALSFIREGTLFFMPFKYPTCLDLQEGAERETSPLPSLLTKYFFLYQSQRTAEWACQLKLTPTG